MATVRKFTFDTRFDEAEQARPTLGQTLAGDGYGGPAFQETSPGQQPPPPDPAAMPDSPAEPEPEPEPEDLGPPLVYTEEDMEIAREEAFVAGHTAALDEASVAAEQAASEALGQAAAALKQMAENVETAHAGYGDLAGRVATEICRRLLPETGEEYAAREISALVQALLPNLIGQPRLIARTHPDLRETIQGALGRACEQIGFEGRLTVIPDSAMQLSDCRIEWSDGGAERNTSRLWDEIDALLERNLPLFRRGDALELPEDEAEDDTPPEPEAEDVWPEDIDPAAWWTPPAPAATPTKDTEPTDEPAEAGTEAEIETEIEATAADGRTTPGAAPSPDAQTDDTVPATGADGDDVPTEDTTSAANGPDDTPTKDPTATSRDGRGRQSVDTDG